MRTIYLLKPVEIEMDEAQQKLLEERVAENRCIRGCDRPLFSRGLCKPCNSQFSSVLQSKKTEAEREAFEKAAIEAGMVLAPNVQRSMRPSSNPFKNLPVPAEGTNHVA